MLDSIWRDLRYVWAAAVLVMGGVSAAYMPARRALGLDPSQALREE